MKLARVIDSRGPIFVSIEGESFRKIRGHPFSADFELGRDEVALSESKLLAPIAPGKLIAFGMNYQSHADEIQQEVPSEPGFFFKPTSSVIGPGEDILYPFQSQQVDYEGELAVVIGRTARNVSPGRALDFVFGYTCFNDVTARDIQFRSVLDFNKAKSFDTFGALGPWIETDLDPTDLKVETRVNGELKQSGRTRDLIYSVPELISFLSLMMTLEPGDVIATGTPSGIGPLQVGDGVIVEVEGIGSLENRVRTCPPVESRTWRLQPEESTASIRSTPKSANEEVQP